MHEIQPPWSPGWTINCLSVNLRPLVVQVNCSGFRPYEHPFEIQETPFPEPHSRGAFRFRTDAIVPAAMSGKKGVSA